MTDLLDHNEYTEVEKPLIDQLLAQTGAARWQWLEGKKDSVAGQGREGFRDVLLKDRVLAALTRINKNPEGKPWLDAERLSTAWRELERLPAANGHSMMEKNQAATKLLLDGTVVGGVSDWDGGRSRRIQYIDWSNPENNEFLIINQYRVNEPVGQHKQFILPDMVLFINGIPLVVIECKSPATTNPLEESISQLLRYSNQRPWIDADEGSEQLFHYVQLTIGSSFDDAVLACPGAQHEHYLPWKDCYPTLISDLSAMFSRTKPAAQQMLAEGVLRPERLLDVIRHFVIFMNVEGRTVKIAPRYQQYRAVVKAMERLETGMTRAQDGEFDRRGGVIFHTQGSGKSLTMVFLIRRMRDHVVLRRFKIVFVTDRSDLQQQLSDTAELTGEGMKVVERVKDLPKVLCKQGSGIIFAMVQKYRSADDEAEAEEAFSFTEPLNESEEILVIIDEAHRSHAKTLHANLMSSMPNAAKIGFTGTPIIMGKKKRTAAIFGEFIDRYTLKEAEDDQAILKILYEFRDAKGEIKDGKTVDEIFEEAFRDRTEEERVAIQKKHATSRAVMESVELIRGKGLDMMRHYIDVVLPNGFKAQITASSRVAVLRYLELMKEARDHWLAQINALPDHLKDLPSDDIDQLDDDTAFLASAWKIRDLIAKLDFAAVMSSGTNDDPAWSEWTDRAKIDQRIERFKKPFIHKDPEKADSLAFLIVKNMLLVGFDAPIEQVLYIDRKLKEDELLQAIARVNRTRSGKNVGYVVDYANIGANLAEALAAYTKQDVEGAFRSAKQELLDLRDRHARVIQVFKDLGISSIEDTESCVDALRPEKERAKFIVAFKQFLKTYGNLEHRPEARKFTRDAKVLGFINQRARNRYRDEQLNIVGVGDKVKHLIDEYVVLHGIDPAIPPIDLMDADFKQHVERQKSSRAAASEMEHAARYHISKKYNEDPQHYQRLSERLKEILNNFSHDASQLRTALETFIDLIKQGRKDDDTGLDPETQAPFFGVIQEAYVKFYGSLPETKRTSLIELTVELVEVIRQEIKRVSFWSDAYKQSVLRGLVIERLDQPKISNDLSFVEPLADKIMEIAKHNHAKLTK